MAHKNLFRSMPGKLIPAADVHNAEGAKAYAYEPKHKLAQVAATGCFGATYYASAGAQLEAILELANRVEPLFVARTAIYARERGHMKDMPALLCAVLAAKAPGVLAEVFERVIDNGKMLRTFVQMLRSGVTGRKSLGTLPKRLVLRWLANRTDEAIFKASVGASPSLADVVKMVHPKPATPARAALYGYLLNKAHDAAALPELVRAYEAFKRGESRAVPAVPFELLTALELDTQAWQGIARHAGWQMTRMNLNTFLRHGVFKDRELTERIAQRLRDPDEIRRAKAFPYQLMVAHAQAHSDVPHAVRMALLDAMDRALANVPVFAGRVAVCPDVSGSMSSAVTGARPGATSVVRCIDVAALIAAAILRQNPAARVIPFESDVVKVKLNARDTVLTNAEKLAKIGGGGTNCSAPLKLLARERAEADLVIYVSDNQSWVDGHAGGRGTGLMAEWEAFKQRNPKAKLVCIDLQPYGTTQAQERADILNVGGFSDHVFEVLDAFHRDRFSGAHWVEIIEQVTW